MKNKQRIASAFEELMKTSYLENISVSDIMERCRLPRTTFYRHFRDKYDLMSYVYRHAIETRLELAVDKDWRNSILICYRHIAERWSFFRHVNKYKGQNSFLQYLNEYSCQCLTRSLCAASGAETLDDRLALSVQMYCSACTHLVDWWLSGERGLSPEQLYEIALENIPICLQGHLDQVKLVLGAEEA